MTPKPDSRVQPTQDEFDAWAEHPVTRWVAAAYAAAAEAQAQQWAALLPMTAKPDTVHLESLRLELLTRMDAYRAFFQTTRDQYAKFLSEA